jgi:hypothetical protein
LDPLRFQLRDQHELAPDVACAADAQRPGRIGEGNPLLDAEAELSIGGQPGRLRYPSVQQPDRCNAGGVGLFARHSGHRGAVTAKQLDRRRRRLLPSKGVHDGGDGAQGADAFHKPFAITHRLRAEAAQIVMILL